jgi:hypothetical protein
LGLTSSVTQEQNKNASPLPSSVIDDICVDISNELSDGNRGAHASSSVVAAPTPVIPSARPTRKTDAERNPASRAVVHLADALGVQPIPPEGDQQSTEALLAIAPSGDLRTGKEMSNQGLAVNHQSDAPIANIRGHRDRTKLLVAEPAIKLAKILPISAAAPLMQFPPTTRAIGPTGRIRVRVNNQSLTELLGWVVGALTVSPDGAWVILRVDFSAKARRRNDRRCTYTADNRLRLSAAICTYLGTPVGHEVALVALPEHGALPLVNPARLLMGAPLSLFDSTGNSKQGGI